MSEETRLIEYIRAYFEKEGTTPSIRKICKEINTTPPTLCARYGPLSRLVEKAGLSMDQATRERMRISAKATRKHVHQAEKKRAKAPKTASTAEAVREEPAHTPAFQELMQESTSKKPSEANIRENARLFIGELKALAWGDDPKCPVSVEVNTAILEELYEIIPMVLNFEHDVWIDVPALLRARRALLQDRKERKRLRAEASRERREREELERQRELLKRDSDRKALIELVDRLQRERKASNDQLNEAMYTVRRFRALFRDIAMIFKCQKCGPAFVQSLNHDGLYEWVQKREWRRLTFEEDPYKQRLRSAY
jgi:hypothetical protein